MNDSCPPASSQSSGQKQKNITHDLDKAMVKKMKILIPQKMQTFLTG
jgi:hypothetical protein